MKTIVSLKTIPRKWVLLHEFGCARNVTLLGLDETLNLYLWDYCNAPF